MRNHQFKCIFACFFFKKETNCYIKYIKFKILGKDFLETISCPSYSVVMEKYIERILHGRAEIRNFSSSVEKYFTSERSELVKYFFNMRRVFVSPSGHVIFYSLYKHQWKNKKNKNIYKYIYYIVTDEIPGFFQRRKFGIQWRYNFYPSHVKISRLSWVLQS